MTNLKDTQQWQLGQWGETHVRKWLERSGKFIVPTTCIEDGGAPALTQLLRRHVLPDFQAFGGGSGEWWEVKTKTRAVLYGITNEWRTGIDVRLWNDYRAVERETGLPGYLAMIHREPELMLLTARMGELVPIPHSGGLAPRVWFRVDDFERVTITPDGPEMPYIAPKTVRAWEVGRTMGARQLPLWVGDEQS